MKQKRILCINDISSMGKCSLTIALPIISSLGIEAVVLPTALLSAHTVFKGYTFKDTTEEMRNTLNHFDSLGEKFDCIYTGYLGSKDQVKIVLDFIKGHKESLIITDPVMGDNGRLYSGFEKDYPEYMLELCNVSDIVIPNLTEACLLTNTPFVESPTESHLERIAGTLSGFLTMGKDFEESIVLATKFTEICINHTANDKDSQWYGLRFEECLHYLFEMK